MIQIVGYKKTGKTTLMCRLIERFTAQGLRVGAIKHDGHEFEPDVAGTDSWLLRHSGASAAAVTSSNRTAFFEERGAALGELVDRMSGCDLILVEGWKREGYPKIALVQSPEQLSMLAGLTELAAVASWNAALEGSIVEAETPSVVNYEDTERISTIVYRILQRNRRTLQE